MLSLTIDRIKCYVYVRLFQNIYIICLLPPDGDLGPKTLRVCILQLWSVPLTVCVCVLLLLGLSFYIYLLTCFGFISVSIFNQTKFWHFH